MIFDRAPADPEIGGDVLAGMSIENQFHDLVLPRRKIRAATCGLPLTRTPACRLCSVRNASHSFEKQSLCPRQGASQSGFLDPV